MLQPLSKSPWITMASLLSFILLTGPAFASSLPPENADPAKEKGAGQAKEKEAARPAERRLAMTSPPAGSAHGFIGTPPGA